MCSSFNKNFIVLICDSAVKSEVNIHRDLQSVGGNNVSLNIRSALFFGKIKDVVRNGIGRPNVLDGGNNNHFFVKFLICHQNNSLSLSLLLLLRNGLRMNSPSAPSGQNNIAN